MLEIETEIENNARNHRLRVHFPSDIKAQYSWGEHSFDVLAHRIDVTKMIELNRQNYRSFVDLNDGKQGLAVVSEGLPEYEIVDASNSIAITLLRATRGKVPVHSGLWIYYDDKEKAQCLGRHKCRYAVYAHGGSWEDAKLYRQAQLHNFPLRIVQHGWGSRGTLKGALSFVRIEPENLILSCIKKAEESDELIIRVYNPTEKLLDSGISLYKKVKSAHVVNLNEEVLPAQEQKKFSLEVSGNVLKFKAPKKKIISLGVRI